MRILHLAPLVLSLLGCKDSIAPKPRGPEIQVSGDWRLVGQVDYGCVDTLDFSLVQNDTVVSSPRGVWYFQCGSAHSDSTVPVLIANGRVHLDSIYMTWYTKSDFVQCPSCQILTMAGAGDSTQLSGVYQDFFGGLGSWIANRR